MAEVVVSDMVPQGVPVSTHVLSSTQSSTCPYTNLNIKAAYIGEYKTNHKFPACNTSVRVVDKSLSEKTHFCLFLSLSTFLPYTLFFGTPNEISSHSGAPAQ